MNSDARERMHNKLQAYLRDEETLNLIIPTENMEDSDEESSETLKKDIDALIEQA